MRSRRSAALLVTLLAGLAACRHVRPARGPLPQDWRSLARTTAPFAALYRFACCGQRNMVLAVRGGPDRVSISVTVPPGSAAMAAWFEGGRGWVQRPRERCRDPLSEGAIPLPGGSQLPLDAAVAARILSGLVAPDARELPLMPGWVESSDERFTWRAEIEGPPAHCVRIVVYPHGGSRPALTAELGSPAGRVPGSVAVTAGSQRAEMVLEEWRPAEPPQPPGWLSLPVCGGAP